MFNFNTSCWYDVLVCLTQSTEHHMKENAFQNKSENGFDREIVMGRFK